MKKKFWQFASSSACHTVTEMKKYPQAACTGFSYYGKFSRNLSLVGSFDTQVGGCPDEIKRFCLRKITQMKHRSV